MRLHQLTALGFVANMAVDRRSPVPFSFDDIYSAAESESITSLFALIDDTGIVRYTLSDEAEKAEINKAIAGAAEALRSREDRKVGVGDNPVCMLVAIILETIQSHFDGPPTTHP